MNFKSFQLLAFSFLALVAVSVGASSRVHAADQVLVEWVVVTDDWVEAKQDIQCGKAEDTSNACQDELRNCVAGIDQIMNNAYRVCGQRPNECKIIDVTATQFTRTAYNLLVSDPIYFYENSAEVAFINNCRMQHPKSEDNAPKPAAIDPAADQALKDRLAAERGEELGVNPAPLVENVAPAPVLNNSAAVVADAENAESNAGGCSMQSSSSSVSALHLLATGLLMSIYFAVSLIQRKKQTVSSLYSVNSTSH